MKLLVYSSGEMQTNGNCNAIIINILHESAQHEYSCNSYITYTIFIKGLKTFVFNSTFRKEMVSTKNSVFEIWEDSDCRPTTLKT